MHGQSGWSASRTVTIAGIGMLIAAAVMLALAPTLMPESYDWRMHAVSESAAQGVEGAWLARLGLMVFGFAAMLIASGARLRWGTPGGVLLGAFGVLLIASAVFSHKPWETDVPYDRTEDLLHSVAATAMGFAFAFGVVAVTVRRGVNAGLARLPDVVVIAVSICIPLAMTYWSGQTGLLQRVMFLAGMVWFAIEALRTARLAVALPESPAR